MGDNVISLYPRLVTKDLDLSEAESKEKSYLEPPTLLIVALSDWTFVCRLGRYLRSYYAEGGVGRSRAQYIGVSAKHHVKSSSYYIAGMAATFPMK